MDHKISKCLGGSNPPNAKSKLKNKKPKHTNMIRIT